MKHLKLFFALFAMLALGIGNAWGAESLQVTLDFTTNSWNLPTSKVVEEQSFTSGSYTIKVKGTSGNGYQFNNQKYLIMGQSGATLTLPAFDFNTTKIVVTGKSGASASVKQNIYVGSNAVSSETTGATGTNTYTINAANQAAGNVYVLKVTSAHNTQITKIEVYGESNSTEPPTPEPEPEPDPTPEPGGDANTVTFTYEDLKEQGASGSGAEFTGATKDPIFMGGKGRGNTSYVQIYANNYLTFTPTNATITKIVLTATSGYIKEWDASKGTIEVSGDKATWTGSSTSTVTLTNTATAQARITQMDVTYTASGSDEPEAEIVKTLESIAVSDMTTIYEQGDAFSFDGKCTATYSVTKDGVEQDPQTAIVTPTSVSEPDMSTAGTKEITVTYTEGEITKTVSYEITIENALPKIVITQDEIADFTNAYAEYTWTASGVSGKIYGYKNSGMQLNSSKDGSYVYNTDPIPGYIRKIKIVKASGSNRQWTPSISETVLTSAGGTTLDQKEVAATTTWEVTGENSYFYLLESGGATVIESITIYYEAVVPQVAAPIFDPIEGTYNSVQNVTISAEEGATIHYTLDGQNPTTESPVYSTPIEIAETKTLKAIAVKGEDVSPIASATYTINLPLTTMDQIFAKATAVGSTATSVEITFGNWVVSAVKEDGKTAFVTDGTKGFVIFDKDVNLGFSVGNTLSGTATCKVQLYNGFAELTELKSNTAGLSVGSGGTITTQELGATAIETLTGVNTGSLIKINGICTQSGSNYYVAGVQIYTALYDFETLKVGAEYNITGIYQQFHSTKEMLPRSAEDIEEVVGLPTATISIADITMEVGETKTIEATITPDAAQSTVQYAITSGNEYITLEGTTITAVAAGETTITATIAEKADEYKGATKEFTVTVKPQNIATLPFAFDDGVNDIKNTLGMSHKNLGTDYTSSPKLKFDDKDDYVIIHFDERPGILSYDIKANTGSGAFSGVFAVQESADGVTYRDLVKYSTISGSKETKTHNCFDKDTRYIKFVFVAKDNGNVALGNIKIETSVVTKATPSVVENAYFSVGNGEFVQFSTGNLQYEVGTNTWSFASEQYEVIGGEAYTGSNNTNYGMNEPGYTGKLDLFGWSSDGKFGVNPSNADADYIGEFADWGNLVNEEGWYTLTKNEMNYILNRKKDGKKLWALATINDKVGLILLPDNWNTSIDLEYGYVPEQFVYTKNLLSISEWQTLEENGAVFLPAAGSRTGGYGNKESAGGTGTFNADGDYFHVDNVNIYGYYWLNTQDTRPAYPHCASYLILPGWSEGPTVDAEGVDDLSTPPAIWSREKRRGNSVRLVKKVTPDHTREVRPGFYGTICLQNGGQMIGASLFELSYYNEAQGLLYMDEAYATMVAGNPYVFLPNERATNNTLYVFCDETTAAAKTVNGLVGSYTKVELAIDAANPNYILKDNKISKVVGRDVFVGANKAYIKLGNVSKNEPAPVPGRRRVAIGQAPQVATGMESVDASAQPVKMIIDGQLYILRGEKMYDAQGKLVK